MTGWDHISEGDGPVRAGCGAGLCCLGRQNQVAGVESGNGPSNWNLPLASLAAWAISPCPQGNSGAWGTGAPVAAHRKQAGPPAPGHQPGSCRAGSGPPWSSRASPPRQDHVGGSSTVPAEGCCGRLAPGMGGGFVPPSSGGDLPVQLGVRGQTQGPGSAPCTAVLVWGRWFPCQGHASWSLGRCMSSMDILCGAGNAAAK